MAQVHEIDATTLSEAVREGLRPYGEALRGAFTLDISGAVTIQPRADYYCLGDGTSLVGSTTPVIGNGEVQGALDIVALPPKSGTGDLRQSTWADYFYDRDFGRHEMPYARKRPAVRRVVAVSLAGFDAQIEGIVPVMHAMRLKKVIGIPHPTGHMSVMDAAMVGQTQADFDKAMAGELKRVSPQAVVTVDLGSTDRHKSPIEAYVNDSSAHFQVFGILALLREVDPAYGTMMTEMLQAQSPTELLLPK